MSDTDVNDIQRAELTERLTTIVEGAVLSIMRNEKMHAFPEKVKGELLLGYLHRIERQGVTQAVAEFQLRESVTLMAQEMIPVLAEIPDTTMARLVVVVHLATDLGMMRVMQMSDFLNALRAGDWEEAADALFRSEWPTLFDARDPKEIDRALTFMRMLRMGTMPEERRKARDVPQSLTMPTDRATYA